MGVVVAQRTADVTDALGDAVLGHIGVGPDRLHDLVTRDELAGAFGEMLEQGEGFWTQRPFRAVHQQDATPQVESRAAEPMILHHRCGGGRPLSRQLSAKFHPGIGT
ncbi:MAG: hypothetical protein WDM85_19075 [Caulobacteraceae bacterium]